MKTVLKSSQVKSNIFI